MNRMVLSIMQYMIWKEKNARRFQQIHQSVRELVSQIKKIVYIIELKSKKNEEPKVKLVRYLAFLVYVRD